MTPTDYRPCVGVMLVNAEGQAFVGRRIDNKEGDWWQMPQGGIDDGEKPRKAALRELWEETGVTDDLVEFIAKTDDWVTYDLPAELLGKVWGGKYRGQRQTWFLARFLGADTDVDIDTAEPEFRAWKWADPRDLPSMIVPFKQALYRAVLDEFAAYL